MAIDATLIQLGPGRVSRWAFDSETEYIKACDAEIEFVESLEAELTRQLKSKVVLPSSLLVTLANKDKETESLSLIVGGSDGLSWLHDSIRSLLSEGLGDSAEQFKQIIDHSAVSGIYLPIDFPRPFTVQLRGDAVSVGSLPRLREELAVWKDKYMMTCERGGDEVTKLWQEYADNLMLVASEAEKECKAVELF